MRSFGVLSAWLFVGALCAGGCGLETTQGDDWFPLYFGTRDWCGEGLYVVPLGADLSSRVPVLCVARDAESTTIRLALINGTCYPIFAGGSDASPGEGIEWTIEAIGGEDHWRPGVLRKAEQRRGSRSLASRTVYRLLPPFGRFRKVDVIPTNKALRLQFEVPLGAARNSGWLDVRFRRRMRLYAIGKQTPQDVVIEGSIRIKRD